MASRLAIDCLLPRYSHSAFTSSGGWRAALASLPQATPPAQTRRSHYSFKTPPDSQVKLTKPSSAASSTWTSANSPLDAVAAAGFNTTANTTATTTQATTPTTPPPTTPDHPLAKLPLQSLLRGLLIQGVMSRPAIADLASNMLRSNMERLAGNPLSRLVLDKMLYAQFCAGRTQLQTRQTVDRLRELGYGGVILAYAREADLSGHSQAEATKTDGDRLHQECVARWLNGSLKTIEYAEQGDFVAIKYSGAGERCVQELTAGLPPDAIVADALRQICHSAEQRGVRLLVDAEHYAQQRGIDSWTMALMEEYNRDGQLVVYNTYQMYLKEAASTLAAHLQQAKAGGFGLGVKLVRGAYINSDPRHLIHDTKGDTDRAFDDAARMLATQHVHDPAAPTVGLVLASHNKASMEMMRDLRREQMSQGQPLADVVYAQLMGMADELSMDLMQKQSPIDETARVVKYVVWGTTEECMMYLLRRAEENREAIERSAASRTALWGELRARMLSS